MTKPRILLWDLETSFYNVLTFNLWQTNINQENILVDSYIHCVSYQWHGQKKIHTISQLDAPERWKKDIHDDYFVVKEFCKVMEQADAHVAHYGDGFDLPKLKARIILNGLPPIKDVISIDTKKLANSAKFGSKKLDYLAQRFGHAGKLHNPKDLWLKCYFGDKEAMKHMAKYNRKDIDALRCVFERLMPYSKVFNLNANQFTGELVCVNPTCGSVKIAKNGFKVTRTGKYQSYKCGECASRFQDRYTINQEVKLDKNNKKVGLK